MLTWVWVTMSTALILPFAFTCCSLILKASKKSIYCEPNHVMSMSVKQWLQAHIGTSMPSSKTKWFENWSNQYSVNNCILCSSFARPSVNRSNAMLAVHSHGESWGKVYITRTFMILPVQMSFFLLLSSKPYSYWLRKMW